MVSTVFKLLTKSVSSKKQTPLPTAKASIKNSQYIKENNSRKYNYIYSSYEKFYIGTDIKPTASLSSILTTNAPPVISEKERAIYYQFLTQRVRVFIYVLV